jgi:hypothetical protein
VFVPQRAERDQRRTLAGRVRRSPGSEGVDPQWREMSIRLTTARRVTTRSIRSTSRISPRPTTPSPTPSRLAHTARHRSPRDGSGVDRPRPRHPAHHQSHQDVPELRRLVVSQHLSQAVTASLHFAGILWPSMDWRRPCRVEIVRRVRDGRVWTNIGNSATLDDAVAAFNLTERISGQTIIRVRP